MAIGRNANSAGPGLMLGAVLWIGMGMGCVQPDPDVQVAGSGTELGNVMGILVTPDRRAAAGVEVMLYPSEEDAGTAQGRVLRDTTNADGAFSFHVEGGVFRLLALDSAGNGVTVDSLRPSPVDTINLQNLDLAPLGGIRGFVKSIPWGAQLRLLGTPFDTSYPGDTEFVWEGIPAGTYWLHVRQTTAKAGGVGLIGYTSRQIVASVVAGTVTALQDTVDLNKYTLELLSAQLPYRLIESFNLLHGALRLMNGVGVDSLFWVLNGSRIENQGTSASTGDITLTETMLDSAHANVLQLFAHSGDSIYLAKHWTISWSRSLPTKWAYQAVRAVVMAMEPDDRPGAKRPGPNGAEPLRGTFRVLEKRVLSPEELEFWEWSAEAGGDSSVSGEIQASIFNPRPLLPREGCRGLVRPSLPNLPGDTITFFLLPDSILGAVAFRPRTGERFQDMDHLGYFARADWPLSSSFSLLDKLEKMTITLRPDGFQIEWPWNISFRGSEETCQSAYRRFLVDSTGRVREILTSPPGIDSSRLLLHYRAEFSTRIDADLLPASGAYVYVDSSGLGVAGSPDSSWQFQLEAGALQELKTLISGLPYPIPAEWHQEYAGSSWQEGLKEALRYLVADQRGALHILEHPGAAPAKADLFSRVELWLRGRNLL